MSNSIHLGFEIGTGRRIEIPLRHTAVTGQTQESGKTTTLEGLITRSGLRAVAYVTKRGESSFHVMNPIAPYFRERTDWQFVAAILEATMSERLKFQRAWIMKLCQARHAKNETWPTPRTLADVQRNVEVALEKAKGMNESVYFELSEYLKMVVPQIDRLPYSPRLELQQGVNVMDLAAYDFPLQALVVRSVIEWIRQHEKNTISVIPEAWKFAPKQRGSPVRLAAEELIREGGALHNFIWLDSQDIAGVADVLLRQIGVWIFGVQRAKHEIERTLEHIPEGILARRPKPGDIATLGKGQFFCCYQREMFKVYVQPAWMSAAHAEAIARGEEDVDSAREILKDFDQEHPVENNRTNQPGLGRVSEKRAGQEVASRAEEKRAEETEKAVQTQKAMNPAERIAQIRKDAHDGEYGEYKSVESDVLFMFEQYDSVVTAHDALAERVRHLEKVAEAKGLPFLERHGDRGPRHSGDGKAGRAGSGEGVLPSPGQCGTECSAADLDRIYRYVVDRAVEDPGILDVLVRRPQLRVTVQREAIEADGKTLRGRLALLIAGKFFDAPATGNSAFNELKRTGFGCAKPNVYRELDKLAELGFVTKQPEGYQVVAGMKIQIKEA